MNDHAPALDATRQTWPAERLYWAVLDAPGVKLRSPGPLPPGLLADLADEVPAPLADLHAIAMPHDGDSKILVCAARRDELHELPRHLRSLHPAGAPDGVDADPQLLAALNLLVGEFEPIAQRRARSHRSIVALATFSLCASLVTIGLVRRAQHWTTIADGARDAANRVVTAALPPGMPAEAIAAEVARLKQASQATTHVKSAPDAAAALASLLAAWPASISSKPQSLAVAESGITISVLVDEDPGAFLRAFAPPRGWLMQEPRINTIDEFTRIVIDLKPAAATPGATP